MLLSNIGVELEHRSREGLNRHRICHDYAQGAVVKIDGINFINFCSNDYLGLSNNAKLKEAFKTAIDKYGIGSGSSQLLTGYSIAHKNLELKLSEFLKRDASLIFPSGYMANLAMASTLIDQNTVVLQDKNNHASLIDAAILSKGRLIRYRHNDIDHLKVLVDKYKQHDLVIMTDGIFSMDGDAAPLEEIAKLCQSYHAILIVDDAHGLGVLGESGGGLIESTGLSQDQVPLLIGTFGKAFGATGAFISGKADIIELMIQKARTFIYTTSLLPAVAETLCTTIDVIKDAVKERKKLTELIKRYRFEIEKTNLNSPKVFSHVQPIIIGDNALTVKLSKFLYKKHILANAIRPPTVPKNSARLRISLGSNHTAEQIDKLIMLLNDAERLA